MDNKPKRNWWDGANYFPLGEGSPTSHAHIIQALSQNSIECGGVTHGCWKNGSGDINEINDSMVALGGRLVEVGYSAKGVAIDWFYVWPDSGVSVRQDTNDGEIQFTYGSTDSELFSKFQEIADTKLQAKKSAGHMYVMVQGRNGPEFHSIGLAGVPVEPGNYAEDVMADFQHVCEDINTNDPCGRISILDGKPGSGKSFLVRGLLDTLPRAMFVWIQPNMVAELASPHVISSLMGLRAQARDRPTVLIVEDADECLVSRENGNMNTISSLLNLSDGIIGTMLDLRIVCTTNAGHLKTDEQLDAAILRPGRLCRRIHVSLLDVSTARKAYRRLTELDDAAERITGPTSIAEVYRMARDAGWKPKPSTTKSMGFSAPQAERRIVASDDDVDDFVDSLKRIR